ncbi:hypothetical protein QMK19_28525 [Streptomyces sp. H10-C2]|uniref:hypothetical protein n=1 Tax=unclassified Streptomyces TaxID=2593676 RepID=UPI0024BB5F87|nr:MULTISPECIES: hypothetical protein [unclassified Streptomyces]MDJ0344016.1 hypothetical protein [Streptomyces sp. PH10-H1]MDJ0373493.1 hypothetical protein [Streptomyces sp. H10-C2]
MATNGMTVHGIDIDTKMLTVGVAVTGVAAFLGLAGTVIVAVTLLNAGRGYVRQMEVPPSERAARALRQAKAVSQAASQAGAEAWRSADVA